MTYDIMVTDQNGVATIHSVFVDSFNAAARLWERADEIVKRERIVCTRVKFVEYAYPHELG